MAISDETELFTRVADDVVCMHGQTWRVRERCLVRVEDLTEPSGSVLGASNWRSGYVGVYGDATFADDLDGQGRSVVLVKRLVYPDDSGLRVTRDMLRTSSGVLQDEGGALTLVTRRTRYVFRRVEGEEALLVRDALAVEPPRGPGDPTDERHLS